MVAEAPPPKFAFVRPVVPGQQKAMLRWAFLPEGRKLARAKRAYQRTWEGAAAAYGVDPNSPAPEAEYLPGSTADGAEATARQYPAAPPRVELSRGEMLRLSRPRGETKRLARQTLLHEWAHIYQAPEVLAEELDKERGANMFADYYGKKLYGVSARDGILRTKAGREYVRKHGRGYWRRGQFGSNYGVEPNSIRYR